MITEVQAQAFFEENAKLMPTEFHFIFPHTELVVAMSELLAVKEGLNAAKARIAAWLHDIGYRYGSKGHSTKGLQMCHEAGFQLDADIEDAIVNHSTSASPQTALGQLLQRADKMSFLAPEIVELLYPSHKELLREMLQAAAALL